jgi:hypothetical protein
MRWWICREPEQQPQFRETIGYIPARVCRNSLGHEGRRSVFRPGLLRQGLFAWQAALQRGWTARRIAGRTMMTYCQFVQESSSEKRSVARLGSD